jgi:FeS assembly SUF system protein
MNFMMRDTASDENDVTLHDFMPSREKSDKSAAAAGAPLPHNQRPAGNDAVVAALQDIYDPEIPVNIYDLGLIYRSDVDERGNVAIEMTLTAPACPVAGEMPGTVAQAVAAVEGVGLVTVQLVWEPRWTPDRMSEDAKLALGMF